MVARKRRFCFRPFGRHYRVTLFRVCRLAIRSVSSVEWTHLLTNVTAEEVVRRGFAQFAWHRTFQLDSHGAYAFAGVEHEGAYESVRRASIEAQRATTAAIFDL